MRILVGGKDERPAALVVESDCSHGGIGAEAVALFPAFGGGVLEARRRQSDMDVAMYVGAVCRRDYRYMMFESLRALFSDSTLRSSKYNLLSIGFLPFWLISNVMPVIG